MNHLSSWRGRKAVGRDHCLREPAAERSCSQSTGNLEVFRGELSWIMSLLGTKKTIRVRGASDTPHTHTLGWMEMLILDFTTICCSHVPRSCVRSSSPCWWKVPEALVFIPAGRGRCEATGWMDQEQRGCSELKVGILSTRQHSFLLLHLFLPCPASQSPIRAASHMSRGLETSVKCSEWSTLDAQE